jgi:hypothetical protein
VVLATWGKVALNVASSSSLGFWELTLRRRQSRNGPILEAARGQGARHAPVSKHGFAGESTRLLLGGHRKRMQRRCRWGGAVWVEV